MLDNPGAVFKLLEDKTPSGGDEALDRTGPVTFVERDVGNAKVFEVQGSLDCHHINEFTQLSEIVKKCSENRIVVLDMSGVKYLDSVGLGTLISMRTTAARRGGHFRMCALQDFVKKVIQTTHLDRALDIYPTAEEALRPQKSSS
jgi:anti-anti-sigma factor